MELIVMNLLIHLRWNLYILVILHGMTPPMYHIPSERLFTIMLAITMLMACPTTWTTIHALGQEL